MIIAGGGSGASVGMIKAKSLDSVVVVELMTAGSRSGISSDDSYARSLGSGVVVEETIATGGRSGESPERSKATSLCSEGVDTAGGGSGTSSIMSKENIPDSVVGVELITAGGKSKSGTSS